MSMSPDQTTRTKTFDPSWLVLGSSWTALDSIVSLVLILDAGASFVRILCRARTLASKRTVRKESTILGPSGFDKAVHRNKTDMLYCLDYLATFVVEEFHLRVRSSATDCWVLPLSFLLQVPGYQLALLPHEMNLLLLYCRGALTPPNYLAAGRP